LAQSVKMYTTTWCGYCRNTKRYLDGKGVAYEEIDIERHPEYGERIEQATGGYRTVPTLEIDGKLLVNPSPREMEAALKA
jgi:mycoredoxin